MAKSIEDLKSRLMEQLRKADPSNPATYGDAISEFMQYSLENYDSFDTETKGMVDALHEEMIGQARKNVELMPDGPDKRQAARLLALFDEKHYPSDGLLRILESPPEEVHPIIAASRPIFLSLVQWQLDILFDVTRHSHRGAASFAKIGLAYWNVDEMLTAYHLAQRRFNNQAYAHLRTVLEILDKLELFDKDSKWAQLWATGESGEVWKELRPAKVREKLGEPKYDPLYSFFSAHGPHSTFDGLQGRVAKRKGSGEGRTQFTLWVGGSKVEHHVIWTHIFCIYAAFRTATKLMVIFGSYLNEKEMIDKAESAAKEFVEFDKNFFLPWAKEQNLDCKELEEFLNKEDWWKTSG